MEVLSRFAALPARPPTPPKEVNGHSATKSDNSTAFLLHHYAQTLLDTPDEFPSSSSERPPKRVDFLPFAEGLSLSSPVIPKLPVSETNIRELPPSRECRPAKSILKPYNSTFQSDPADELPIYDQQSLPIMLEEIARELTSSSKSTRLDAYKTLNGCLKAYDDIPDIQAMKDKLPLITAFIHRDLTEEVECMGVLETQMATQILKLIAIFLWSPTISDMLQDDFRAFILDQATTMIEEPKTQKALVSHCMTLLATQDFGSKVMNNERANRLLTILNGITNHVKGNGVVGQRLRIYRKLLNQTNPLMVARIGDWIDHLFSGMLSTMKEVRDRALSLGFDASTKLGTQQRVSRVVVEVLNRTSPDKKKFVGFMATRLSKMVSSKNDESLHVPQIWTVVILFLRSRRDQLAHWEHLAIWLRVLQKCFNCSDNQVKFQTNIAWNRLIFAVGPEKDTSLSMMQMLRQPIKSQMERTSVDKHSNQAKQIAFTSYATLLYYAFQPGAPHAALDMFWEDLVGSMLPLGPQATKVEIIFACQVLISLFGDGENAQKVWDRERAIGNSTIKAVELPRLDPKWVRSRARLVLRVISKLLISKNWHSLDGDDSWVVRVWRSFMRALKDAGTKEIKTSMDCMIGLAATMTSIQQLWLQRSNSQSNPIGSNEHEVLERLVQLVDVTVESLGPRCFSEKRLTQRLPGSFEAAETPWTRSILHHGLVTSPINHLIEMLASSTDETDKKSNDAIAHLIDIALRPTTSSRSKLKVLRDIAQLSMNEFVWARAANFLPGCIRSLKTESASRDSSQPIGHDYREVIKVLELGIRSGSESHALSWAKIFHEIDMQVTQDAGAGGSIISIIEPLAGFLDQLVFNGYNDRLIGYATILIRRGRWVDSPREIDRAHKAIWGAAPTTKTTSISPCENLLALMADTLYNSHRASQSLPLDNRLDLLRAVDSLIAICPIHIFCLVLKRVQKGIGAWVEDLGGLMGIKYDPNHTQLLAVSALWVTVTDRLRCLEKFDSTLLLTLEPLLCMSLSSRHKSLLSLSISFWNDTFGSSIALEYPDDLRRVILRVSLISDITTPGTVLGEEEVDLEQTPFDFLEPQGNDEGLPQPQVYFPEITENSVPIQLPSLNKKNDRTPHPSPRKPQPRLTPTPRLRHDSSQLQFSAIESSPLSVDPINPQLLTNRQKEVRERQFQETAMFSDLRSSPRPKSRGTPASLSLMVDTAGEETHREEAMLSPTLPAFKDMTIFLGSSPTPSVRRSSSRSFVNGNDPPSSPPIRGRDFQKVISKASLSAARNRSRHGKNGDLAREPVVSTGSPPIDAMDSTTSLTQEYSDRGRTTKSTIDDFADNVVVNQAPKDEPFSVPEENVPLETEVFADAPVHRDTSSVNPEDSLIEAKLETAHEGSPIARDLTLPAVSDLAAEPTTTTGQNMLSTAKANGETHETSNTETVFSDHEEQVSAQIKYDMEMAMSQSQSQSQAAESTVSSSPLEIPNNRQEEKRRSTSFKTVVSRKIGGRPRRACASGTARAISRVQDGDDEIYDCIVVSSPFGTDSSSSGGPIPLQVREFKDGRTKREPKAVDTSPQATGQSKQMKRRHSTSENEGPPKSSILAIESPRKRRHTERFNNHAALKRQEDLSSCKEYTLPSMLVVESNTSRYDTSAVSEMDTYDSGDKNKDTFHESPMFKAANRGDGDEELPQNESDEARTARPVGSEPEGTSAMCHVTRIGGDGVIVDAMNVAANGSGGSDMIGRLRQMLEEAAKMTLTRGEGREIMSAWMDLGKELQEADHRGR